MVSISSTHNTAALTLLQSGQQTSSATGFLNSSSFSASSDGVFNAIFDAFSSSRDLQKQFSAAFKKATENGVATDGSHILPNNAKHIALVDVIVANREAFPPEEFTVQTELWDGGSITTTIPSAVSMEASSFQEKTAEKQAAYDASVMETEPDPEVVKLNAMSQVVKSLVLDNGELANDGQGDEAALMILARTYLDQAQVNGSGR